MADFPHGTLTLVFTDLEGSSELSERHGAAFEPVRNVHFALLRAAAEEWHGHEVETAGDSLFLVFARAADAVRFAVTAQRALAEYSWPPEIGAIRVRIGMATGEPFAGQDRGRPTYRGPVTNRAARVMGAGHGGQILLSQSSYEQAAPVGDSEITFLDLGLHRLKGVGEENFWQVCHPRLPQEFPALETLPLARLHLPQFLSPFVGRERDVREVAKLLRSDKIRLLALQGSGGIGKTRLATRIAEEVVRDFTHGLWFVELETTQTRVEFFERLARHIGLDPLPGQAEQESVLSFLQDKKALLVLDNLEQNPESAAAIELVLQTAPGVKCLATSRERLAISSAQAYEVEPLDIPAPSLPRELLLEVESVQFFVERARVHQHDFAMTEENAEAVSALCRRLEGVPLALELAAAWVPDLTPHEILEEITQQLDLLEVEHADVPERQRGMRSSIDWSYQRLAEDERDVFVALSVFSGGCTLEAAALVCAVPRPKMLVLLRKLNAKSLLSSEQAASKTRFRMLHTLRIYARSRLSDLSSATLLEQRHAAYFAEMAAAQIQKLRTPEETQSLQELDADLDNVRSALEWSAQAGEDRLAARLALSLGQFLQRRGFLREALSRIELGSESARRLDEAQDVRLKAELLREQAALYLDRFEWPTARRYAHEAQTLFQHIEDAAGEADILNLLGLIANREQEYSRARLHFEEAIRLYEQVANEGCVGVVLNNLGLVEHEEGHTEQAALRLEQALAIRRRRGDRRGIAETSNNLGTLKQDGHELQAAWNYYEESLRFEEELQDIFGMARALNNLGEVAQLRGDIACAWRLFTAATHLFTEAGSPYQEYSADHLQRVEEQISSPPYCPHLATMSPGEVVGWALEHGRAQSLPAGPE